MTMPLHPFEIVKPQSLPSYNYSSKLFYWLRTMSSERTSCYCTNDEMTGISLQCTAIPAASASCAAPVIQRTPPWVPPPAAHLKGAGQKHHFSPFPSSWHHSKRWFWDWHRVVWQLATCVPSCQPERKKWALSALLLHVPSEEAGWKISANETIVNHLLSLFSCTCHRFQSLPRVWQNILPMVCSSGLILVQALPFWLSL